MPHVTDIQPQKKHQHLFNIYLDDSFAFSLSDLELSNRGLQIGDELDEATVEQLQLRSQISKGYAMALRLLSRRPRSEHELRDYLQRKALSPKATDEICQKLTNLGLIDDYAFALAWVENRNLLKPRSTRALRAELRQKGIDRQLIDEVLNNIDTNTETKNILTLIDKKKKNPRYSEPRLLTDYLMRQGFSYGAIQKAFAELAAREHQSESDAD